MILTATAQAITEAVRESVVLRPVVKAELEFNHNRFSSPAVGVDETLLDERFDHESIIGMNRPKEEIRYAVAGYARAADFDDVDSDRFRAWGEDSQYNYLKTNSLGSDNNGLRVTVGYSFMRANKIYVRFNTHLGAANPQSVKVYQRTPASGWVLVGTQSPNASGEIVLWLQDNDTWSSQKTLGNEQTMNGIRVVVDAGPAQDAYVEIVEMSASLVLDVSDRVVSVSSDHKRDEPSATAPMGVSTAGTLTLELDDTDLEFSGPLANSKLRQPDALVRVEFGYNIDGSDYLIAQPDHWVDSWGVEPDAAKVTLTCTDAARWIQKSTTQDTIYENRTVQGIVTDLLEKSGLAGVDFRLAPDDAVQRLPWVWYRNGEALWDALTTVAGAVQASWHQGEDRMQWFSRSEDYEQSAPVYLFSSEPDGDQIPNLFSVKHQFDEIINSVKISYEEINPNVNPLGETIRQVVWQSQGDVSLRSSDLQEPITSLLKEPPPVVKIDPDDAEIWPFEGKFQIEGEAFSYRGKVKDDESIAYGPDDAGFEQQYTGELANIERAIDDTSPDVHEIASVDGARLTAVRAVPVNRNIGRSTKLVEGKLRMQSRATANKYRIGVPGRVPTVVRGHDIYYSLVRGVNIDSYEVYATEVTFPPEAIGNRDNIAGIVLHKESTETGRGYYFELVHDDHVTSRADSIGHLRAYVNNGQSNSGLPNTPEGIRGKSFPIQYDKPYRIEVVVGRNDAQEQQFYFFVDGVLAASFKDETYDQGLWGPYVRGNTTADFEYFYCYESDADNRFVTDEKKVASVIAARRLFDRINGAYTYAGPELAQSGRSSLFRWFFEEYQPVVHERRDFEVEHSVSPAFDYVFFNSNPTGVRAHNVLHTPFRSEFSLDNSSRDNEFLSGSDDRGNNYFMQVFAQPLNRLDSQQVTVSNRDSVRQHGLNEIEYANPWVQTEEQANDIGDYISDRWAKPLDTVTVEVPYDPAIELGDMVEVSHYERRLYSRYYFVTGISVGWNDGFTCGLTLRRNHQYYY